MASPPPHPPSGRLGVAAALAVFCASGTLLTLANKVAVGALPAPHSLLVLQNGATVALLLALSHAAPARFGALPPLTAAAVRTWLPLTLLFVAMLASSLLALQSVSAVTLIVVRNVCTLVVAFLERAVLGARHSTLTVATLLGILLGAALYGAADLSFSASGYAWLAVNVAATAAFQVYVKWLIAAQPKAGPDALGPFHMSYYNNVISLPVLALVVAAAGEGPRLPALLAALTPGGWLAVLGSAVLGFALSTSAFLASTLVSATSMMVASNVCKFALFIVAVQSPLAPLATLGAAAVALSAWLYAQSKGPWASGWFHGAFDKLGTWRLLLVCALALIAAAGFHGERPASLGSFAWGETSSVSPCRSQANFTTFQEHFNQTLQKLNSDSTYRCRPSSISFSSACGLNGSAVACHSSTCVFRNVCVRGLEASLLGGSLHLFPVIEFAAPALPPSDALPDSFVVGTESVHPISYLGLYVPAFLAHMDVDNNAIAFQPGLTVLAGYYGAENFGHQIHDNWSRFESLRAIGVAAAVENNRAHSAESIPSHLLLARDCDTYDYSFAGPHMSRSHFAAACHAHQRRFLPLSSFATAQSVSPNRSACFEYLVAGHCDEKGRLGFSERRLPLEAVWDFRNAVYGKLRIPWDEAPMSPNILVVVKPSFARDPQNHATPAAAEALAEFLRISTGFAVDVVPLGGPADSIESQVLQMLNYTHVVLPGGGAGFIAMLAPFTAHMLVAAYDPGERLSLEAVSCFARLSTIKISNRAYDHNAVLAAVRSPPALAKCDLASYKTSRSNFVRLPALK